MTASVAESWLAHDTQLQLNGLEWGSGATRVGRGWPRCGSVSFYGYARGQSNRLYV